MADSNISAVMLPILRTLADGKEMRITDIPGRIAQEDPSVSTSHKLVSKAVKHLKEAGLIKKSGRGAVHLSASGKRTLQENPNKIDRRFLRRFPDYVSYEKRMRRRGISSSSVRPIAEIISLPPRSTPAIYDPNKTPTLWPLSYGAEVNEAEDADASEEADVSVVTKTPSSRKPASVVSKRPDNLARQLQLLETPILQGIERLNDQLYALLAEQVIALDKAEQLTVVTDTLKALGLGGPHSVVRRWGPHEAVLEDVLGIKRVHVAVIEGNQIVANDLQKFGVSLSTSRAKLSVLLCPVSSNDMADGFAAGVNARVVIIDHEELAHLMMEADVGVTEQVSHVLRRLDTQLFG